MSFLIGPAPIRRTLNYLKTCPLIFREQVKIVEIHCNIYSLKKLKRPIYSSDIHDGLRNFYFWHIDPIQYNNPDIQFVRFLDINPLPFIRCWLDTGEDVLFDCDSKSKDEIMNQLIKTLGKSKKDLEAEQMKNAEAQKDNPAIFGYNKSRFCMCEIEGQVPCSGVVPIPIPMRNKYIYNKPDEREAFENNPDAQLWDFEWNRNKYWNKLPLKPQKERFPGLERIQIGKLHNETYKNIFEEQQKTYLQLKAEREAKKKLAKTKKNDLSDI